MVNDSGGDAIGDPGGGDGLAGGGGGDSDTSHGEAVIISDVVLAFTHSWFQGNNHQEIVKLCLASFSTAQLAEATKLVMEKIPGCGKFIAHRDTAGRPASEMFAGDILKVLQYLDNQTDLSVKFCCDSISMRSVKVSTMLFSEEEPIKWLSWKNPSVNCLLVRNFCSH